MGYVITQICIQIASKALLENSSSSYWKCQHFSVCHRLQISVASFIWTMNLIRQQCLIFWWKKHKTATAPKMFWRRVSQLKSNGTIHIFQSSFWNFKSKAKVLQRIQYFSIIIYSLARGVVNRLAYECDSNDAAALYKL
jgi:hypothetical protein